MGHFCQGKRGGGEKKVGHFLVFSIIFFTCLATGAMIIVNNYTIKRLAMMIFKGSLGDVEGW